MSGPIAYNVTLNGTASQVTGYGATELESGYYLVRNTVVPDGEGVTFSDYIVDVVGGDVKAEPKDASPSSAKKVQDVNDSLSATLSSGQDSADYDIGDTVPFTLTATLPTNYSNFSTVGYKLIFVDDLSAGFTWDGSATIYYGKDDTAGESVTFIDQTGEVIHTLGGEDITATSAYSGGKVWALDLGNLMDENASAMIKALKGGDTITVKYNATLNASAKVDDYGNRNSYRLYYSSNPTNWQDVGSTTDDVNVVFTYKTVFNKVDENGAALTGADFTLEKFVADQNGTVTIDNIKGKWVNVTALHTGAGAVNPTKTGGATGSQFTFSGLDDGIYRLTETTTPAGYNKIDPIQFTITAEHEVQSEVAALKSLTGTSGADLTMTPSLPNASLTASVKNEPGIVLPATGGLGTVTLVAVGSGLAIVTFVVLITRRRLRVE
jgi:fimbrial isopeptide formation D2 family protein